MIFVQALITESDGNVVVSPASVKAALTTLVEGTGGRTAKEILSLLRLPSDPNGIREAAKRSLAPFRVRSSRASTFFRFISTYVSSLFYYRHLESGLSWISLRVSGPEMEFKSSRDTATFCVSIMPAIFSR